MGLMRRRSVPTLVLPILSINQAPGLGRMVGNADYPAEAYIGARQIRHKHSFTGSLARWGNSENNRVVRRPCFSSETHNRHLSGFREPLR